MLLFYLSLIDEENVKDIFGDIYEHHLDWMLKIAYHFSKSEADAQDIVHDVFMEIIKNDCSIPIEDYDKTKAYLFICIRNRATKIKKSKIKQKFTSIDHLFNISAEDNLEDQIVKDDIRSSLLTFINKLSDKYKDILTLNLVYNKTSKEISKIMCIPQKTVETRLRRGKIILKERFKDLDI